LLTGATCCCVGSAAGGGRGAIRSGSVNRLLTGLLTG
jgi:hypothetical protein